MTAFAAFMHVLYGPHLLDYSTMFATYAAMFGGFLGNFDYHGVTEATGLLGGIMLIAYLLVMMNVYLNFFISILSEYMSALRGDPAAVPKDHEVIQHLMKILASIVSSEDEQKRRRRAGKKNFRDTFQ